MNNKITSDVILFSKNWNAALRKHNVMRKMRKVKLPIDFVVEFEIKFGGDLILFCIKVYILLLLDVIQTVYENSHKRVLSKTLIQFSLKGPTWKASLK